MTLTEIMVVLVIAILLIAVLVPSLTSLFMLDQRKAARNLTILYEQLHDEAVMRNVTFRISYNLRAGTYEVQVGEAGALIFDSVEAREDWEEAEKRKIALMNDEELAAHAHERKRFQNLAARFKTKFELPSQTVFGGIYTPQYGEMVTPDSLGEDDEGIIFSYVFPNGQAEHTVVWLVNELDEEDGFTIEVEPLSGSVKLTGELVSWEDSYSFVPTEGPDLSDL